MAWSWLTATSTSQVQMILLTQPLELLLQISVGRIGETLRLAAFCVEFYQVAGNVFEFALGAVRDFVPSTAAEFAQLRFHTLFATVFREFVQRVDRAEYDVAVLIDEFNHLLQSAVGTVAHQSAKLADALASQSAGITGMTHCTQPN